MSWKMDGDMMRSALIGTVSKFFCRYLRPTGQNVWLNRPFVSKLWKFRLNQIVRK